MNQETIERRLCTIFPYLSPQQLDGYSTILDAHALNSTYFIMVNQCWHLCAVAVWVSITVTAMITMAFVYTGRLQYCANDVDRVAFCPIEQTIGTSKQTHNAKVNDMHSETNCKCSDSSLLDNDAFIMTLYFNLWPLVCTFWGSEQGTVLAVLISNVAIFLRIWKTLLLGS
jgi:hypothetical protein